MQSHFQWLVQHLLDTGRVDDTDAKILQSLINNGREAIKSIADYTEKSRPTIYDRIKRLESEGIIDYYTTQLNYNRCGLPVTAFILVTYDPAVEKEGSSQKQVAAKLSQLDYVKRVNIITGNYSFIVEIAIDHMRSLADLIIEEMRKIPGVGTTVTNVSFGSYQNGSEINIPTRASVFTSTTT